MTEVVELRAPARPVVRAGRRTRPPASGEGGDATQRRHNAPNRVPSARPTCVRMRRPAGDLPLGARRCRKRGELGGKHCANGKRSPRQKPGRPRSSIRAAVRQSARPRPRLAHARLPEAQEDGTPAARADPAARALLDPAPARAARRRRARCTSGNTWRARSCSTRARKARRCTWCCAGRVLICRQGDPVNGPHRGDPGRRAVRRARAARRHTAHGAGARRSITASSPPCRAPTSTGCSKRTPRSRPRSRCSSRATSGRSSSRAT